jgi:hypothetical protein
MNLLPKRVMRTHIDINAAPAEVWSVLSSLSSYGEWNPAIIAARGDLRVGARLTLRFHPKGTRGYTFRPKLLVVDPPYELRWLGSPRLPLVFDTEHYFSVSAIGSRGSRLDHGLVAYGLGTPLAARTMNRVTKRHFELMNHALKRRVEQTALGGEHP